MASLTITQTSPVVNTVSVTQTVSPVTLEITEQITQHTVVVSPQNITNYYGGGEVLAALTGVAAQSTNLGTFTEDIIADNETIKGALQDLEDGVVNNEAAIGTNASDISTNATGISDNANDITGLTSTVNGNTSSIGTNTSDITSLQTTVGTNTAAISTNSANIGTNSTDISTNATAISGNTTDIASNLSAIGTNSTDIATLQSDTAGNLTGSVTVHSDVSNAGSGQIITGPERTKLLGIAAGAEVNVQADWTEANTGSDAFIQNKPALGTAAAADVSDFIEDDSTIAAQPIRQYYANTAAFPSASTWHGAIAHSHADGAMYFAHGGSWVKLGNDSDIFDGDYNSLTNQPNIPVVGTDAQAHDANLTTFVNAFTLPVTDGSNGQVLTTNGSGTLSFASSGGSGSTTLLGLTDTPAAFGSTGQVLAVNSAGNAVEFVNQSGGSGAQRTLTVPSGNGYSGDVVTFGSAPSGGFTVGELYYFASTGAWEEAYGTSTSTSIGMLGVCVNATTPELLVRGIIKNSNYANQFTLARRLYVSTLQGGSGRFMDSVPGSPPSGAVIRAAGFVTDAVNGVIMFDPSQDYITVT